MSGSVVNPNTTEPVSILDRDQVRPIIVEPDETADVVLPLIVLIVLIVFLGWMLYLMIKSGFKSTNPDDPVSSDNRVTTSILCATGQCATNIMSGFKSCPNEDVAIAVNPAEEVCNSPFVCDNPLTPYALQSDGSTNLNGVCEPGAQCPCLRVSQCAQYILTVFTTSNGNPYQTLNGQRITFPQQSSYVNTSGIPTTNPPIQYNNPATTFCGVPLAWLPLSNPGCNFVNNPNSMTFEELLICMGMINGCNGVTGSPCLQGVLAVISDNPDTVTQQTITTNQFGCVAGLPCPCGQIAIFDTNFGGIVCRELN